LPSVGPEALGKVFLIKKKEKKNFAECRAIGTRQSIFYKKKKKTLPSAGPEEKNFTEYRAWGGRQS
jgi:hypothetical protein